MIVYNTSTEVSQPLDLKNTSVTLKKQRKHRGYGARLFTAETDRHTCSEYAQEKRREFIWGRAADNTTTQKAFIDCYLSDEDNVS